MFSDELNDVNVSLIYINRSTWSKQISEHTRNQKVPVARLPCVHAVITLPVCIQ